MSRRLRRRIAVVRREIERLAAIAAVRAARAGDCAAPSFRPLNMDEAEAIVGAELLGALSLEYGQAGH